MIKKLLQIWLLILFCMMANTSFAQQTINIGAKNFTEQLVLAEIAKQILEDAGYDVNIVSGIATILARQSLELGELDLYYEYTGTGYAVIHKQHDRNIMTDNRKILAWLRQADKKFRLTWLEPLNFNNTYAIASNQTIATAPFSTMTELAAYLKDQHINDYSVAVNAEAFARTDGLLALLNFYKIPVQASNIRKMDAGLVYLALKQKEVNFGIVYNTDGRIDAYQLQTFVDDKLFFPVYHPAPVVRNDLLKKHPDIASHLNKVATVLDTKTMRHLNAQVDIEHQKVKDVVHEWLLKNRLLPSQ